jgi:hypothetical protein
VNFEGLRANIQFVSSTEGIGSGDRHTGGPFQMARAFYHNRNLGLPRRRYNKAL